MAGRALLPDRWAWLPGGACAALLIGSAPSQGYFGDELYYLACAARLDFGYVDHPPLSIWLLRAWTAPFGDSVVSLRVLPALAIVLASGGAATLARQMGAGRFAQVLAAALMVCAPVHLVIGSFYSMNALDAALWCWALAWVCHVLEAPSTRGWLVLGALLGVGLLDKLSVLWLGAGLGVALLATRHRRELQTPGPYLCAALALSIASPYAVWQLLHGAPTLEFMAAASRAKMLPVGPVELVKQQLLAVGPAAAPLWIGGLVWLARGGPALRFRVHAIVFGVVAAILVANGSSRPTYLALAQAPLLAAGATGLERWAVGERRWLRPAFAALLAGSTAVLLPLALPVLEPARLIAYQEALGLRTPRMEAGHTSPMPDHFANRHGFRELVDAVERAYQSLPADDRAGAIVLTLGYTEAAALEHLGRDRHLPPVFSVHNNYWLWGPPAEEPRVVLFLGPAKAAAPHAASVEVAGEVRCEHCRAQLNGLPILIVRKLHVPLSRMWPSLATFI